jgi:hypothetical protein
MVRQFKEFRFGLFLIVTLFISLTVSADEVSFNVKYLSAEHIYIDGGASKGLTAGDTLSVYRDNALIGSIVAEFVSDHSASCKKFSTDVIFEVGDEARINVNIEQAKTVVADTTARISMAKEPETHALSKDISPKQPVDISGRVSIQYYYVDDKSPANLDFKQPTLRLNLKFKNLGGDGYSLNLKTRTRHNDRMKNYNSSVSESEWRNRLYEISYSRDINNNRFGFRAGRIVANEISGVGYLDGLLLKTRIIQNSSFGVFAGAQPQWQYADFQTSLQKYGGYLNFVKGDYGKFRWESTMAFAAEYHSSIVSREFIYFQNSVGNGGKWRIYQSLDLDFNRGWRKDKSGESITLSNLYLTGRYKFTSWFSAGLSYDNRVNYWTYDIQQLDENLFDDRYRRGVKFNLRLMLPNRYSISSNFGIRSIENNSESSNYYYVGFNKSNFTPLRVNYNLNYSSFSNEYTDGQRYTISLSRYFSRGHSLRVEYGNYSYDYKLLNINRDSNWIKLGMFARLKKRFYYSGDLTFNSGDDINGNHILAELGYRF